MENETKQCPDCVAGYSDAYHLLAKHISKLLWDANAIKQSKEYRAVTTFLSGREPGGVVGHDASDVWMAVRKLGQLAGLPDRWHVCETCDGSDDSDYRNNGGLE